MMMIMARMQLQGHLYKCWEMTSMTTWKHRVVSVLPLLVGRFIAHLFRKVVCLPLFGSDVFCWFRRVFHIRFGSELGRSIFFECFCISLLFRLGRYISRCVFRVFHIRFGSELAALLSLCVSRCRCGSHWALVCSLSGFRCRFGSDRAVAVFPQVFFIVVFDPTWPFCFLYVFFIVVVVPTGPSYFLQVFFIVVVVPYWAVLLS